MKRLLLSSLLGCMLISNVQAGELVTSKNALFVAKGLAIGAAPLVARGAVVALDSWLLKRKNIKKSSRTISFDTFLFFAKRTLP